ncbi:MAG: Xaa-Pro peptidase family protein [Solirubrobacteraceae bacterium]|nr:Xaa-Pro peptidase family protein [Solirubrobacteraceae bacterium]
MERQDIAQFAHGQFRTDYEIRPDPYDLREARVERVRAEMRARGLDALLVWKNENVRYLTGLRAQIIAGKSALLNGCVLPVEGPPILLASGGEIERCRTIMPWIGELHAVPIMEARGLVRGAVESVIGPVLRRHGLAQGGVLGIDEAAFCQYEALGELLPGIRLEDGDAAMQAARLVKLPGELALMQEACAIAEAVTQSAIDAVRPGVRELDVVADAMHTLFRLGGEEAHVTTPFVASGEHMAPPNRIASDKIIRDGDLVFIDIGAQWAGYFGDMGRTVVCGEPGERQREVYTAVYDALQAATDAMRAGNTNRDVERAVHEAAGRHGLADRFISLFIGHGVGMGANEPPYLGESLPGDETVVLEEGMTFAVEPLIWVPGVVGGAGVRLEDTIVVGADGGRSLTRTGFDGRLLLGDRPTRRHDAAPVAAM